MKSFILISFNYTFAFQNAAFYREHSDERLMSDHDHNEFAKVYKNLISTGFDPGLVDDYDLFHLREIVDHLARGLTTHNHGGQRIELQEFAKVNRPEKKNRRKSWSKYRKRARKRFLEHHRQN